MSKHSSSKTAKSPRSGTGQKSVKSGNFVDRNLCKVNPLQEQFEPTDAVPIRQRARMAGAG